MIDFRAVRLEDREIIERYVYMSGSVNCDLSFANMFCWQPKYRTAWAIVEDFLVLRFQIDGGHRTGYMQPLGCGDLGAVVEALRKDAHAHSERLRIIGLSDEGRRALGQLQQERFAFDSLPSGEDYIYRREDLELLRGRRYQPKRNHINRFTALYPDYEFRPLGRDLVAECLALEERWRDEHETAGTVLESDLDAELQAMHRAFENFDALGMAGGALYTGGRMVAFTYGSAVNGHTFVTHIEKADTAYDGAFAMINRLMAEHLPPRFTLINREEDLGLAGLRKSKLSYHPLRLEHKYTAIDLFDEERQCKELWTEAFGDNEEFIDSFLVRHFSHRQMRSVKIDGRLAAMLHLIPFDAGGRRYIYIYGVATATEFRGRGLASRLLREAMAEIDAMNATAFLIPSPGVEWLRGFYEKFGFKGSVPVKFHTSDGFDFGTGNAATDIAMVRQSAQATAEQLQELLLVDNI